MAAEEKKMIELECCFDGCGEKAEFQIIDKNDSDPYSCITDSCQKHVGDLIGHRQGVEVTEGVLSEWAVVEL